MSMVLESGVTRGFRAVLAQRRPGTAALQCSGGVPAADGWQDLLMGTATLQGRR